MSRLLRVEATIASLAPGGDGVAHVTLGGVRRAVFVPRAAPNDRLLADVDFSHRPARGRLLEVLAAGPERVTPPCPWSTPCGGCDWMHLSRAAQADGHVEHVRRALPARWRDREVHYREAPDALAHRCRARVHVRCERGRVLVGMHQARSHRLVEVDRCAIMDPQLERARASLAALFERSRGAGNVQLALGTNRVPVLDVTWSGDLAPAFFSQLERSVSAGELAGARVRLGGANRPATVGDPTPWMTGGDGQPLRLPPGGFGQANERVNEMLVRHVAEQAALWGDETAVELYAGAGNLSVLLASPGPPNGGGELAVSRELVLVESSSEACDAARWNLAMRGLRARVVCAEAEEYSWSASVRLVVLDPPRTGARAVAERLALSRVAHVIYVSCDTPTLARDLGVLAGAYEPVSVTA
ncbi:MAG: class I SAM-dependent RNA methyltransferase, partial [Myxococcota bacterium]|nr:class I SAM-dependent RNA methyltransferase [Myxococcota bacterium]